MAQKVQVLLVDDLEGGEADETVTFALDGLFYEIDLNTANATKLRDLLEPYRSNARRAGTNNLRAKGHSTVTRSTTGRATVIAIDDSAQVRDWARRYDVPVNERGRVKGAVREAYEAFRKGNRDPLRALLKDNNLDPAAADTDGKTILAEPATPKPKPAEDRTRVIAKQTRELSTAQLRRLRLAFNDEDGHYVSDGRDAMSCNALVTRELFKQIAERTYEITPAGRLWFEVRDISPDL